MIIGNFAEGMLQEAARHWHRLTLLENPFDYNSKVPLVWCKESTGHTVHWVTGVPHCPCCCDQTVSIQLQ